MCYAISVDVLRSYENYVARYMRTNAQNEIEESYIIVSLIIKMLDWLNSFIPSS